MNRGLVRGLVFYADGKRASNIYIKIKRVDGDLGRIRIKGAPPYGDAETRTDSNGKFVIPFLWEGSDFTEGLVITISLVAFNIIITSSNSDATTASGSLEVRGYLFKDIKNLLRSSSPLLSNVDLQAYAPDLQYAIKRLLSGRFWNSALISTESWVMLGAGALYLNGSQQEFELAPEFETPNYSSKQPTSSSQKCSCSNESSSAQAMQADPGIGWERDNESFTKRSAELHLKNHYRINDTVQQIINCCVDTDFYSRRCDFITTKNIKGTVMWSQLTKHVTILLCIDGKKSICWYNYFISKGQLNLRHIKCLKQSGKCNS
jgi:hypothetical protein